MAENGHSHGDNAEYYSLRAQAMQALLIEKGVCTLGDILTMADQIDARSPEDGAKILAHAWVDLEYKKRLLDDAESAFLELGYDSLRRHPKSPSWRTPTRSTTWRCALYVPASPGQSSDARPPGTKA